MPLDTLFSLANFTALAGWLVLLASPILPDRVRVVPRLIIPALLATAYVALILSGWGDSQGGFSTLDDVARLFGSRTVLLAGWLHYLAFDLFVGAWITEDAPRGGVWFWLVVPCLVLCFLFGPAGLLLYFALRWATGRPDAVAARWTGSTLP